ncbi:MAG TPA: hypothetical protein VG733_07295 [Chthoniobacteraceae bacterium]|nr:hypothetical protein [Chthoniobacteraceae bacterium]
MKATNQAQAIVFGLIGAAIGGCAGYFGFFWMVRQGFYALVLPPGLLGFVAGLCARRRSVLLAVICGLAGLGLGLFADWKLEPFIADRGFGYYLAHIQQLRPVTLAMLAIGTFFSCRLALGFEKPQARNPDTSAS